MCISRDAPPARRAGWCLEDAQCNPCLQQSRKGGRVSPWTQHPGWSPGMGCVPSFTRVVCCLGTTLAGAPWGLQMLQGRVVLGSELCPVLDQCRGSRTLGWGSGELVGIQAASPSPWLPFEQSFPQRNHRFPCPASQLSSHQTAAADLLSIQAELRQGMLQTQPQRPLSSQTGGREEKLWQAQITVSNCCTLSSYLVLLLLLCLLAWPPSLLPTKIKSPL